MTQSINPPTPEQIVKTAYPSAREEPKGMFFVAIRARERDDATGKIVRDHLLASGKDAREAWADAAREVQEDAQLATVGSKSREEATLSEAYTQRER